MPILLLLVFFNMGAAESVELENKEEHKKESIVTTVSEYVPSKEYWAAGVAFLARNVNIRPLKYSSYLALELVWLGSLIKYKRYAYLPACLSIMIPWITEILQVFHLVSGKLYSALEVNSSYDKNKNAVCLLLLAAGYAYEVHQEKKKHKKREQEIVSEA